MRPQGFEAVENCEKVLQPYGEYIYTPASGLWSLINLNTRDLCLLFMFMELDMLDEDHGKVVLREFTDCQAALCIQYMSCKTLGTDILSQLWMHVSGNDWPMWCNPGWYDERCGSEGRRSWESVSALEFTHSCLQWDDGGAVTSPTGFIKRIRAENHSIFEGHSLKL